MEIALKLWSIDNWQHKVNWREKTFEIITTTTTTAATYRTMEFGKRNHHIETYIGHTTMYGP